MYEPLIFGLSYTVEAVFVYEPCLFGLSYTRSAVFVYGNREAPPCPLCHVTMIGDIQRFLLILGKHFGR